MVNPERQRVESELESLAVKHDRLLFFLKSDDLENLSAVQRELLLEQSFHMARYRTILQMRLDAWDE